MGFVNLKLSFLQQNMNIRMLSNVHQQLHADNFPNKNYLANFSYFSVL